MPYEIPQFPAPLAIPRNADAAEAVRRSNAHEERVKTSKEVQDLKNALIRQIVAAIDKQYLAELHDKFTNDIPHSIPDILTYLFRNFADVDVEDVDKEAESLNQMHWDISEPPMVFITPIEDLQVFATSAGVPRSESQLIAIGVKIIQRTGDFEKGLLEWFDLPAADKTWDRFKEHFLEAHRALKKVRGKTIRNTNFFQANMVEEVNQNISKMKADILESMSVYHNNSHPSYDASTYSTPTMTTQASSVTANDTVSNADLLKLIQNLQAQILSQPMPKQKGKRIVSKYCWTHGACAHAYKDCRNKKPGHKDDANFNNRMDGSDYFCKVAADQGVFVPK